MIQKNFLLALFILFLFTACDTPEEKYENHIERGHTYFKEHDYSKARLEYKNAAQIRPSDHEVIYYLGLVEEAEGNLQKALSAYITAEQQKADYVPALRKIAEFYLTGGILDEASIRVEKILQLEPDNATAHALKASILLANKRFSLAQDEINTAFENDPDNLVAFSVQAGIYSALDRNNEAIDVLDRALSVHPKEMSFYLLKASLHGKEGNIDAVASIYKTLFDLFPDRTNLRFDLAAILLANNKVDAAEDVYRQLVTDFPDLLQAKSEFVNFLKTEKSIAEAERTIQKFISNNPDQPIFRLWLSDLYIDNGRDDEAISTLQSLIGKNPDDAVGLNATTNLARIELGKGEMALAETLVGKVLLKDAGNSQARLLQAELAFQRADYQTAISELRGIVQDGTNLLKAYRLLAETLLIQNRPDLAIDTLIQASRKHPQNTETLVRLAQLYALRDDYKKADNILQAASAINPSNPLINETKARLAIKNNNLSQASEAVNALREMKGQEETARYLQGRILQKAGEEQQAIDLYKSIIRENSTSPLAAYALSSIMETVKNQNQLNDVKVFLNGLNLESALIYTVIGEIENALGNRSAANSAFQKAIDLSPDSQKPFLALSRNLVAANELDQAIRILQQALNTVPNDIEAPMIMAELLTEQGEYNQAITTYESLLDTYGANDILANNYAQMVADYQYNNASALDKARLAAERFINSDNPYYLDTLGWVYYQQGQYAQAQPVLERAIRLLDNPNAQIEYHYGATLHALGRNEEAISYLENAVKGDNYPHKDEAMKLLQSLN